MNEIYITNSRYSPIHKDLLLVNGEGELLLYPGIQPKILKKRLNKLPYEEWYTYIQKEWSGHLTSRITIDDVKELIPLEVYLVLEGGV